MEVALDQGPSDKYKESRQYERELRRSRGEISCLECRRMKIKCDRKVPCSSCVKRHCEDKCPNGSTRSSAADVKRLEAELEKARERIRELEKALQMAPAKGADYIHPLSSETQRPTSSSNSTSSSSELPDPDDVDQGVAEVFGTLSIADSGESVFIGPSAASESFMLSDLGPRTVDDVLPKMPPEINGLIQMWPFTQTVPNKDALQSTIESQLPSFERASSLCEAYLHNLTWFHLSITREYLMEELIPLIYHRNRRPSTVSRVDVRDLALLFAVFACGSAADLTQKANNNEARLYYYLSRATLGLASGVCRGCLQAVLSMSLQGLYHLLACPTDDSEEAWRLHSIAMSSATTLGLHRDPGRWKLSPKMQEHRRRVFWGLCSLDYYRALSCGRPPIISLDSVDVKYPQDASISAYTDGAPGTGYYFYALEFLRRCLAPVVQRFCANPRPVKLREVMEYDKIIREFEADRAAWLAQQVTSHVIDVTDSVTVVKHLMSFRNSDSPSIPSVLMGIHRNFFARAILDYPDDPLRSPFAFSFLTALRLAITMIQKLKEATEINLSWVIRKWPVWSHSLNSAVIVGSVASRCPTSSLAPAAYSALESAIASFRKATEHQIASRGLPILLRLQEKALRVTRVGGTQNSSPYDSEDERDDELSILRGTSRLVSHKYNAGPTNAAQVNNDLRLIPELSSITFELPANTFEGASSANPISILPDADDWVANIDAIMASYSQQDLDQPTAGLAAEAGSFVSLAPEAFTPSALDAHIHPMEFPGISAATWDTYVGNDVSDDLVDLSWK